MLRLLKIVRVQKIYEYFLSNSERKIPYFRLILFCIIYIIMNHFCACIMYAIALNQYDYNSQENMVTFFSNNFI